MSRIAKALWRTQNVPVRSQAQSTFESARDVGNTQSHDRPHKCYYARNAIHTNSYRGVNVTQSYFPHPSSAIGNQYDILWAERACMSAVYTNTVCGFVRMGSILHGFINVATRMISDIWRWIDKSLAEYRKQQAVGMKEMRVVYTLPLSNTHIWFRCSKRLNLSSAMSFCCAENRTYAANVAFTVLKNSLPLRLWRRL
jgi:hypothetical protein